MGSEAVNCPRCNGTGNHYSQQAGAWVDCLHPSHIFVEPEEEFTYEGFWIRLRCPSCGDYTEIEGDVSNGEDVECEVCHHKGKVGGR